MKQKIVAVLLCLGILGSVACAQKVEIADGESVVHVYETADKGTELFLLVVKTGADVNNNDNICAKSYATPDENGNVEFEFAMKEGNEGVYDIYVKQDGKALIKYAEAFSYASVNSRTNLVNIARAGNFAEAFKDENEITLEAIGCEYDMLADGEISAVVGLASEYVENTLILTEKTTAEAFNRALAAVKFNNSSDKSNYQDYLNMMNLEFEDIEDNELLSMIEECMFANKQYESVNAMLDAYDIANILYKISVSRVDGIESLLTNYSNVLGISNESEYRKYIALSDKTIANESIVRSIKESSVYTVRSLLDIIGKAAELTATPVGGGGSSSSGGVGASGGSSGKVYMNIIPDVDEENEVSLFNDMNKNHWAYSAIDCLAEKRIISGDDAGNFRPDDTIKREEFIKMLVCAANIYEENAKCEFDDVSENSWYYSYIASGYSAGIVIGITEKLFGVGNNITRQDMMVLAGRCAGELTKIKDYPIFSDEEEISDYAKYEVVRLYEAGMVSGMGNNEFVPHGTATRAQAAQIIYNIFVK